MCGIAKFVTDPRARKILQETDGIGTPATRATIIERLLDRHFIERRKRQLRATPVGRALIDALPGVATTPDLTAMWESGLGRIEDRQLAPERFMSAVQAQLGNLVESGRGAGALTLPSVPPTAAGARSRSPAKSGRKGPGRALGRGRGGTPCSR